MANNQKKYASLTSLQNLVDNIKSLFVKKTDLNTELAKKADSAHTHTIANVTNLQTSLDAKVPTSRTVNGKALTTDIALSASDVGAADSSHNHDSSYYTQTQIDTKLSGKSDTTHNHDDKYDAKNTASTVVSTHNTSTTAHNDIRDLINGLTTRLNALADSDDTTLDQMSEIVEYIKSNKSLIDSITTNKVNVSDIVNNLTTNVTNKPLSAAQGVAIKSLIDTLQSELDSHTHAIADVSGLQSALDGKAASSHGTHVSYSTTAPVMDGTASVGTASTVARSDHKHPTDTSRASKTEFDSHDANTTKHITATERTNWNAAKTHADSAHAPSNAQPNQNAFSNIKVGSTTIAADTTTDTLTLAGTNVTITPDETNDKVTIAVADATTSAKGVVQLTDSVTSTSTTTAATPKNVKAAYDLANTAKTTADGKANASHTHTVANITDLTATATELNYMDGVTSNVQAQLDSKAASSHNHSGSNITSGTVAAARLPVASDSAAGIVSATTQSFKGNKTFTGTVTANNLAAGADTSSIGNSLNPFDDAYINTLNIGSTLNNGSVSNGGVFKLSKAGTTTTSGVATLQLGNNVASGNAGNAYGTIEIYNENTGCATIRTSHEDSRKIYIDLPENGGMLLTDDDLSGYSKTSHTHSASGITSGILPVERGGTGNSNGYVRAGALSGSTIGTLATAEGRNTTASGNYSHAEGNYTEATGSSSHAEGQNSTASGTAAHAEGENTTASGSYSHAEGENTLASSKNQHVQGRFNKEDASGTYAHIVGNGTSSSSRSNAHTIDWNGNAWFAGNIYTGGTSQSSGATMLASVSSLTTAEYTALEEAQATNANTLYMLTDSEEEEEVFITVEDIDDICGGSV